VLRDNPRDWLQRYREELDMTFNYSLVQLALHCDRSLAGSRPAGRAHDERC
jgi:hypothetical protein